MGQHTVTFDETDLRLIIRAHAEKEFGHEVTKITLNVKAKYEDRPGSDYNYRYGFDNVKVELGRKIETSTVERGGPNDL